MENSDRKAKRCPYLYSSTANATSIHGGRNLLINYLKMKIQNRHRDGLGLN